MFYSLNYMKALISFAAASIAAASTLVAAPANAADCTRYPNGIACAERISGSVERLGLKFNDGSTFIGDITCTGTSWILHEGWTGNFSRSQASSVVEAYCDGRGSMFVGG